MKLLWEILKSFLIVIILTITTQIGGLIYLIYKPIGAWIKKKKINKWKRLAIRFALFTLLYLLSSLVIVPLIARMNNKTPLPYFSSEKRNIKPATILYCLANRHYVNNELYDVLINVSNEIKNNDQNIKIVYLDANFPFIKGFPLLPHLSHNDGNKVDLSFIYTESGNPINKTISVFGYGVCEVPSKSEFDQPNYCKQQGYWQYNIIRKLAFRKRKEKYKFDINLNSALIQHLSDNSSVSKIFIEPHLKIRLGLSDYNKIRYHGCGAVRHDDHIHVQI